MEKNLITEIRRISELIGIENKITLNEGAIGKLFGVTLEKELNAIIRNEVITAIRTGLKKNITRDATVVAKTEAEVLAKSGLKSLSKGQKMGIKAEMLRIEQAELKKAAQKELKSTAKAQLEKDAELAARESSLAAKEAEALAKKETISISLVNTMNQNVGDLASKGVKKTTTRGTSKTLKATAKDLADAEAKGMTKVIEKGGAEEVEVLVKKGFSFKQIVKSCAFKWGVGLLAAGLIAWWILSTMSTVPEDLPVTPPTPTPPNPVPPNPDPTTARYHVCTGTYTQGCKTDPTGAIGQVQQCLGLVVDGKFWNKTQAALVSKGFADGFKDSDITTICGGTPPTPAPDPDTVIDDSEDLVTDTGV